MPASPPTGTLSRWPPDMLEERLETREDLTHFRSAGLIVHQRSFRWKRDTLLGLQWTKVGLSC